MSSPEFTLLHIIHVASAMMLVAFTFLAFAAAPETKRRVLTMAGLGSLLVLLTGIRMWQAQFTFVLAGWIVVKLVSWLAVSAFGGMAYKRREKAGLFAVLTLVFAVLAVVMVYLKPF